MEVMKISDEFNDNEKCSVKFTKKQPYIVRNLNNLKNSKGEKLETKPTMALCYCGKSTNKPYCDGSHTKISEDEQNFDYQKNPRIKEYKGTDITIHYDPDVCCYITACVTNLPEVFNLEKRPWINPDGASVEKIIETIDKCQSGALSYTIGDRCSQNDFDREPEIRVSKDGPLEVDGCIFISDFEVIKPACKSHYVLCRCGGSKNKPFCDASHKKINFKDDKN